MFCFKSIYRFVNVYISVVAFRTYRSVPNPNDRDVNAPPDFPDAAESVVGKVGVSPRANMSA